MLKQNLTEVNNMVYLAIIAAEEMDLQEGLDDVALVTRTMNQRGFYNSLTSGIIASLSSIISDDTMYYLKNANKYLQLTLKSLNGSVASGTPTADDITALKNSSVKGLGSYIIYVLSAVGEMSEYFKDASKEELDKNSELYKDLLDNMADLKEMIDEMQIIEKYGEADYLKEFNIELGFDSDDFVNDEDLEDDIEVDAENAGGIYKWASSTNTPLDFGDFEEEEEE